MKKYLICSVVLFFLVSFTSVNATLIGIKDQLGYPDIEFDSQGTLDYNASANTLVLNASDLSITFVDDRGAETWENGTWDNLNRDVAMNIYGVVDNEGNWQSGYMIEEVKPEKSVIIAGETYEAGITLLKGEISAFGWDIASDSFDFVIASGMVGALVDDGVWSDPYGTGIVVFGEDQVNPNPSDPWSWQADFGFTNAKGDKAPLVPEPGTLLLLGSGLMGLVGYGKVRFRRKKK